MYMTENLIATPLYEDASSDINLLSRWLIQLFKKTEHFFSQLIVKVRLGNLPFYKEKGTNLRGQRLTLMT